MAPARTLPRFLATASLLQALPDAGSRPVLDLACGFGHVAHHLATRHDPRAVVEHWLRLLRR